MANKHPIKKSEARILIYLKNADEVLRYGRAISRKLQIDYCYLNGILAGMKDKRWITGTDKFNKIFYEVTEKAPTLKEIEESMKWSQEKLRT